MEKVLTKELRWIMRGHERILQQQWYFEYGDSYKWEDVPTIIESE
jgi:hypothetical protein